MEIRLSSNRVISITWVHVLVRWHLYTVWTSKPIYHCCWRLGTLRRLDISCNYSHRWALPLLPWGRISTTSTLSLFTAWVRNTTQQDINQIILFSDICVQICGNCYENCRSYKGNQWIMHRSMFHGIFWMIGQHWSSYSLVPDSTKPLTGPMMTQITAASLSRWLDW